MKCQRSLGDDRPERDEGGALGDHGVVEGDRRGPADDGQVTRPGPGDTAPREGQRGKGRVI
jgi:hypothetical protein